MFRKFGQTYLFWSLCAALWSTLCFVIPDFVDNPVGDWISLFSVAAYIVSVGIFHLLVLYVIGFYRYACAVLLPLYAITGAVCSYYRLIYHVSITPLLLDAALHTHAREAAGVVSVWLVLWLILNLGISILLIRARFRRVAQPVPFWHFCLGLLLVFAYMNVIPRLKSALIMRYPLNITYSIAEYIADLNRPLPVRTYPALVADNSPDSIFVIAVLGEATRADHLHLNGYDRETTPCLSRRNDVVSLPHVYSQYTHTIGSIPHIITRADSANVDVANSEHSFVSLFGQAGFNTIWLSNKNQTKPFWAFMDESDTVLYTDAARKQALYAKWLDEDLLPLMDTFIAASPKQLFVLHTMGSHWMYDTHVSDDLFTFTPTTSNRDIRQNTKEQIINSYDNTVVYLDAFIQAIINRFEHYPAIILYLSDHGESLGEGGRYLHAQEDAEEEKYPAAIIWYSDKYASLYPDKIKALIQNKDKRYRTDYYFYSILYAAGIEAEGDNPEMNIFR